LLAFGLCCCLLSSWIRWLSLKCRSFFVETLLFQKSSWKYLLFFLSPLSSPCLQPL
jgi:hypothetical protein